MAGAFASLLSTATRGVVKVGLMRGETRAVLGNLAQDLSAALNRGGRHGDGLYMRSIVRAKHMGHDGECPATRAGLGTRTRSALCGVQPPGTFGLFADGPGRSLHGTALRLSLEWREPAVIDGHSAL